MRPRANILVWAGFVTALLGAVTYVPVFSRFASTRDFPWVNLLLLAAAISLIAVGLRRAFRRPDLYRGKVIGSIFAVLTLSMIGLFGYVVFFLAKQLPAAGSAIQAGQSAPEFEMASSDGRRVRLAELLSGNRGVLLIFYRGYW